ncbi:MASE1 domain-containing protein [Dyella sp.]|jgi:glucose-6-phosphate-specific signal transduction histidine kinase|uniref:MASE1 domain-containing protein n=1 Tax=Dyella sp. TaxID=1869338 RepID=UPI002B68E09C|nr:MASE1 domain-containing protein [Dyella sp.]HTC26289.1 MASE1 domain-containing protein [Dyella sp.]
MLKSIAENKWVRQIAVALGYALIYTVLRPYSGGVWTVTAGLRLSCLLLFPYRYWPALIVGEGAAILAFYYPLAERFGSLWVAVNSIPPMLIGAPVVWWCTRKLGLFPSKRTIKLKALLFCIATLSLIWVATSFASGFTASASASVSHHYQWIEIPYSVLGKYVGILTIVPLALALKLRERLPWRAQLNQWAKSRLTLDIAMLLLPTLAVLVWMYRSASVDVRQVIHMAMFLPVAWLTSKHGWRAAAIGTTVVMFCIFIGTVSQPDLGLVETQAFIAFASTSLFALGVRISAQNALEEQERLNAHAAVKLAQQGLYACELRMRQTAQALEQIGGTLQLTHTRLLNRFKHMLPLTEGQTYFKQAATTQNQVYRLAESMHPTAWRERGLPAALRETIARSLDESGMAYRFQLKGRGLSQLSSGVHAAIYRLACEAVVYICEQQEWSSVAITLRGGLTNGQQWAMLRVEGITQPSHVNDPIYTKCDSRQLALKLGTNGLGIAAMRDHVRLYEGDLHVRRIDDKIQISALVHDANEQLREATTGAPARELYIR